MAYHKDLSEKKCKVNRCRKKAIISRTKCLHHYNLYLAERKRKRIESWKK